MSKDILENDINTINMGKNIVAIIHNYRDRAISLLYCNHRDTEYDLWEMEIGVAWPIYNQKNIKATMGQQYSDPTRQDTYIVANIHIYGARANFLLLYDHQDTESDQREKELGVAVSIFTNKNIKGSMGQQYS